MARRVELTVDGVADVRRARHAIGDLLVESGCDVDLVDDARLAVSEVVTNALVHGAPPVRFRAELANGQLRVEVSDGSPERGSPQPASATAASGRGLAIVDSLRGRWGIDSRDGGKAVWLEYDLEDAPGRPLRPVYLLGVPVAAYIEAQEQLDGAVHEVELLALEGDATFVALSEQVVAPLRKAMSVFDGARRQGRAETEAARSMGASTADVTWHLPDDAVEAAAAWAAGVDALIRAADDGLLLTPPPSELIRELRRWLVQQVADQLLRGAPPRPFEAEEHQHRARSGPVS